MPQKHRTAEMRGRDVEVFTDDIPYIPGNRLDTLAKSTLQSPP